MPDFDLDAIKDRLAAATAFRREDYAEEVDGTYCVACGENIRMHDGAEYDPDRTVCDRCAAELWCNAAKDIAALIAEVERLRTKVEQLRTDWYYARALCDALTPPPRGS